MDFMWRDQKEKVMFDNAREFVNDSINSIANKKKLGFSYREDQHKYALAILDAIKDKSILLSQAGVGIGKSFGYLIPVYSCFKNIDNFEKVIISTSTIALQNQLLGDIDRLNKFLNMDLKAEIAKGVNNYVCIKEMEKLANTTSDGKTKELINNLENEIYEKKTIDKTYLSDIPEKIWKKIQMKNRGVCSNCTYSRRCLFKHHINEVEKADIVITNHPYFASMVRNENNFISNADMYVFDEAHKLEDAIRSINESSILLHDIQNSIVYFEKNGFVNNAMLSYKQEVLISNINFLFRRIMQTSSGIFKKGNNSDLVDITDCDKIPVNGARYVSDINAILKELGYIIKLISNSREVQSDREAKSVLRHLEQYFDLFCDMKSGKNSKNIYWANFYKNNKIDLGYVKKDDIFTINSIFGRNKPVLCTSATMLDAKASYGYLKKGLHLDGRSLKDTSIIDGKAYPSPFDYNRNSLVYYDTSVSNPNNYNQYVSDLADRIKELISITDGRSLVLFTSKSTMQSVYDIVSKEDFGFKLLMQGQNRMDNSLLCKEFENDVHSCLFATGAFWEGIDIKGESLSNVIITRLPFPVVDAIAEAKASKYSSKDAFEEVYENIMVCNLAQGCGRAIRSKTDKALICILDSRVVNYIDCIKNSTPYVNYTDDINKVIKFSNKHIKILKKK